MKIKTSLALLIFIFCQVATVLQWSLADPKGKPEKKPALNISVTTSEGGSLQASVEKSLKNTLSENLKLTSENEELKKKLSDLENYSRGIVLLSNNMKGENDNLRAKAEKAKESDARFSELELKARDLEALCDELKTKNAEDAAFVEKLTAANKVLLELMDNNVLEKQNREYKSQLDKARDGEALSLKAMAQSEKNKQAYIRECGIVHYNLGCMLFKATDYQRAVKEFKKTIELDPLNADAFFNLGILYDDYMNDNATALACYKKYLDIKSETPGRDQNTINHVKKRMAEAELRERPNSLP